MVTMRSRDGVRETFPLYRVDLDLHYEPSVIAESHDLYYEDSDNESMAFRSASGHGAD